MACIKLYIHVGIYSYDEVASQLHGICYLKTLCRGMVCGKLIRLLIIWFYCKAGNILGHVYISVSQLYMAKNNILKRMICTIVLQLAIASQLAIYFNIANQLASYKLAFGDKQSLDMAKCNLQSISSNCCIFITEFIALQNGDFLRAREYKA